MSQCKPHSARMEMPFNLCRIGQLLRETREKRGITLNEASNALFIRKRVIGAIEAGDWDNLPHPVYVKWIRETVCCLSHMLDLLKSEAASGEDESPVQGPEAFPSFHSQDAGSSRPDCCEETPNVLGRLKGWRLTRRANGREHPLISR